MIVKTLVNKYYHMYFDLEKSKKTKERENGTRTVLGTKDTDNYKDASLLQLFLSNGVHI